MSTPDLPDISVVAAQLTADWKRINELKPSISHNLCSTGHAILVRAQNFSSDEPLSERQAEVLRAVAEMIHEILVRTEMLLSELQAMNVEQ